MQRLKRFFGVVPAIVSIAVVLVGGCRKIETTHKASGQETNVPPAEVRIGYFGNLTHAQAVLGVSSGEFGEAIKPSVLTAKVFNAGPSLIEALLAGEIDVGYVGPGPVLNAHLRGRGKDVRVISAAAANGVLIVARKDSGIEKLEDLKGKRVATPQHGNTQDIAARHYLTHVLGQEDAANVVPIANPEQLKMMEDGQIDAAWAPEPWGSRLVAQAGAHVVAEEKDIWPAKVFVLTLVITTPRFLENHPDVVRKMLEVHHHWTVRLQREPEKYAPRLEEALFALSGKKLPPGVLESSIQTVRFLDDPLPDTIKTMGDWAYDLKLAPHPPDLTGLIDTSILKRIETQKSAP
jgi:NitT/TauT family transport system substrate-binding protein